MIDIANILADEAAFILEHTCTGIPKSVIHVPGPDYIDRVVAHKNRKPAVLRNLNAFFNHGRLSGTGYMSLLPVDQGVEHSAGASFAPNSAFFDPANIIELAIEGGCNGVASTLGVLNSIARDYAHKIPFIVKINHNELLSYPNQYDQTLFASVDQAFDMGAVAVGATVYFGSGQSQSRRQIQEISEAFEHAHDLGLVCVLWAYLRNVRIIMSRLILPDRPITWQRPLMRISLNRNRRKITAASMLSSLARLTQKCIPN